MIFFIYSFPFLGPEYNCRLYHMDHWSLPDGPSAFLINDRPLIDNGGRIGTFYENRCQSKHCFYSSSSFLIVRAFLAIFRIFSSKIFDFYYFYYLPLFFSNISHFNDGPPFAWRGIHLLWVLKDDFHCNSEVHLKSYCTHFCPFQRSWMYRTALFQPAALQFL